MFGKLTRVHNIFPIVTALASSRLVLALFDDPEGSNLLVVFVMAGVIYFVALITLRLSPKVLLLGGCKRTVLFIFAQLLIAAILYFSLR